MITPNPHDAIHKAWLYRLLINLNENEIINRMYAFKGGTCAAMRGLLNRFSVDLDFEIIEFMTEIEMLTFRKELEKIFNKLNLKIKDQSKTVPQYFLKYENKENQRNTIKLDFIPKTAKSNEYELVRFHEIDRIINCYTIETMFANKLVAIIDRYEKHKIIAGRDLYDIHYFFIQGFKFNERIIKERTKLNTVKFFQKLISFVEKQITQTIITQDLSYLIEAKEFQKIRKTLKEETLMFLKDQLILQSSK